MYWMYLLLIIREGKLGYLSIYPSIIIIIIHTIFTEDSKNKVNDSQITAWT